MLRPSTPGAAAIARGLLLLAVTGAAVLAADRLQVASRQTGALLLGSPAVALLTVGLVRTARRARRDTLAREAQRHGDARARALIEHAADVVCVVAEDGTAQWIAPSARRVLGHDPAELQQRPVTALVHPADRAGVEAGFRDALAGGAPLTLAARVRHGDGHWIRAEAVADDRRDDPRIGGVLLTVRDVGEREALVEQLRSQATTDPLTGLPNRRRLETELRSMLRHGPVAVVLVDLDDFKFVNDVHGHAAGDQLLRDVAERLRRATADDDLVTRNGGDEFVVASAGSADPGAATALAERVLAALGAPLVIEGRPVPVRASAGVTVVARGTRAPAAMREADIAMYAAKRAGGHGVRRFTPDLQRQVVDRHELGARLPDALRRGELVLDYQPIVAVGRGDLVGMEALVRWEHPRRGRLAPAAFVPFAEETGTVAELGLWVAEQACADLERLRAAAGRALFVTINVSPRQLADAAFADGMQGVLERTAVPPGAVTLELTESVFAQHLPTMREQLQRLKALGVRLAVDDFGTGYSVLGHLRDLPIDVVKVDRTFLPDVGGAVEHVRLFDGIVALADALGLDVVAEGVESAPQARRLAATPVRFGQGFWYGRPMPADGLARQLGDERSAPVAGVSGG